MANFLRVDSQPYASELFAQAGVALYGDNWQGPMAQAMGLNVRTVQRIGASARDGEPYRIPPALMDELAKLVRAREGELKAVWMDIKRGWAEG